MGEETTDEAMVRKTVLEVLENSDYNTITALKAGQEASEKLQMDLSKPRWEKLVLNVVLEYVQQRRTKRAAASVQQDDVDDQPVQVQKHEEDRIICTLSDIRTKVVLSSYDGHKLVGIKDYYYEDGIECDSSAGYYLNAKQWSKLRKNVPAIEKAIRKMRERLDLCDEDALKWPCKNGQKRELVSKASEKDRESEEGELDCDGDRIICTLSEIRTRVNRIRFKGESLVAIEKYRYKDGIEHLCFDGIFLTAAHWSKLRENVPAVEKAIKKMKETISEQEHMSVSEVKSAKGYLNKDNDNDSKDVGNESDDMLLEQSGKNGQKSKLVSKPSEDSNNDEEKALSPGSKSQVNETIKYDDSLVGKKVKIFWAIDQLYFEGVVESYDPTLKEHTIVYTDGYTESIDLEKRKWAVIKEFTGTSREFDVEADLNDKVKSSQNSSQQYISDEETGSDDESLNLSENKDEEEETDSDKSSSSSSVLEDKDPFKYYASEDEDGNCLGIVCLRSALKIVNRATKEAFSKRKRAATKNKVVKETINYDDSLVGKKVKVWSALDEKYYEGEVELYEPTLKEHTICYTNGYTQSVNLEETKWESIKEFSEVDVEADKEKSNDETPKIGSKSGKKKQKVVN